MIQNYSRYRVLQEFFNSPRKDFQMRELSRRVKLAQPSIINHLKALSKENLIIKEKKGIYPTFRANRENNMFSLYKKIDLMLRLKQIGLLDYINDLCMPDSLILFGSASRGEDIEGSDIDIFIQAPEKNLSLENYEKQINRKISLFFEENFMRLSKELKNNILNGILLKGYIKVF